MYDKCYFCLDQLPKLKKESTASFFVNFGGVGVQKSRPTLLYKTNLLTGNDKSLQMKILPRYNKPTTKRPSFKAPIPNWSRFLVQCIMNETIMGSPSKTSTAIGTRRAAELWMKNFIFRNISHNRLK